MNNKELWNTILELEQELGLKKRFFAELMKEDDWSFIIKIHALYEAAVSKLLTNKLSLSELEDFITRLELGDRARGKLKLAKELNLLDENERKFIYSLSEIRNQFVHNVHNTQNTLDEYLAELSAEKQKNIVKTFGYTYPELLEFNDKKLNSLVFTKENLKIAIWQNSMHVMAVIHSLSATEKALKSITESIMEIYYEKRS